MLKADLSLLFTYDEAVRNEGIELLCGVDEAGRGPLAGPVFAAAVIFPPQVEIPGLNDSKKLTPARRERLFDEILDKALYCAVASASEQEIDRQNILNATYLAMRRAVEQLQELPELILVDGNRAGKLPATSRCIVGGDGISASIAAASVLAKVSRDRYMLALAEEYPQYGFEQHKGYPTQLHYERLREYGPCPAHRRTFLKKLH